MARRGARLGRTALATATALVTAATLAACGGGGAGGSGGPVTSLRVLDYYNNEPENTVYADLLNACGQQAGVTIEREVVPGASLIAKVLQ